MTQLVDIILQEGQLEGTSATLAIWLIKEGDSVKAGQPIAELETDKVTMELCATTDGTVKSLTAVQGDEIVPEQIVGHIAVGDAEGVATPIINQKTAETLSGLDNAKDNIQSTVIQLEQGQLEGTSATLSAWLVKVGESVIEGQPLVELETDKVTMEICAKANGTVTELTVAQGCEITPEQILGTISSGDRTSGDVTKQVQSVSTNSATNNKVEVSTSATHLDNNASARNNVSPAVRRLLKKNTLSIDTINGTGKGGRVTRNDVLAYMQNPPSPKVEDISLTSQPSPYSVNDNRQSRPLKGEMVPHTQMRKAIANHMVHSLLETSPHVTSVFEMDMSNIIEHRKWHKKEFEQLGAKLTFTAYFLAAMVEGVKTVPQVNARFHQDALEVFKDVNIGVGTALGEAGLVVPVVEQVNEMNLFEIAKALTAQTDKARNGKLTAKDMKNGTITISNHGVSGSLFATPIIINQPEVAILGIGKLEKRVCVEEVNGEDTMVIRPKCYVSLSIDHRALDAHQTNMFLNSFVSTIENWGQ